MWATYTWPATSSVEIVDEKLVVELASLFGTRTETYSIAEIKAVGKPPELRHCMGHRPSGMKGFNAECTIVGENRTAYVYVASCRDGRWYRVITREGLLIYACP